MGPFVKRIMIHLSIHHHRQEYLPSLFGSETQQASHAIQYCEVANSELTNAKTIQSTKVAKYFALCEKTKLSSRSLRQSLIVY